MLRILDIDQNAIAATGAGGQTGLGEDGDVMALVGGAAFAILALEGGADRAVSGFSPGSPSEQISSSSLERTLDVAEL